MSWGSDTNANKFKKSYIQGFLDISGGNIIVESSSLIQVMSNEYAGQPALLIKPDRFSVFTGQSSYDISYETFAALGFLGTSYEYTTADIYNRIQFIASNTLEGNKTLIGSDASYTDLIVYGNVETRSNGNIIGAKNLLLTGDASLNQKLYVASNVRMDADLSVNQNLYVTGRSQLNNDVSMNRNVDIGTGNNSVAINKDISANIALDVSGATVFRGPVSINQDVSFNQALKVGTDLSVNRYLDVGNNALFNTDVSINQNLFVSGKATIGRPPTSTAYEFDLSGQQRIYEPTGTRATATAGSLVFEHGDASGVSSIVFLSKNNPGSDYAYIQYEENVGGASEKGVLTIGVENDTGSAGSSDRMSLYAAGGSGFVGVNTKTPIFHLDISGTANVSSTLTTNVIDPSNVASLMTIAQSQIAGNLDIGNNSGRTGPINIGTANTSKTITVGGASSGTTTIQGGTITINPASILELGNNDADVAISIGRDQTTGTLDIGNNTGRTAAINIGTGSSLKTMSIGGAATTLQMYGVDASFAGNVKLGSGNKFVAINKDVSANIALDVSGATVLRGITSTLSDVSINGKLLVSGDVSLNQKLFVNNDVSFNSNLSVGQALTVNNRALFSADVSLNKNTRLGTGINSVAINKDISSQYALDVSGTTSLRGPLYTLSDVSINGKLSVGGDISLNGNISIGTTLQTIGIGLKQPPAPMTANVTNIPGHGSYYAYTSSYGDLNPYFLFDNNDATVYNSVAGYTNPVGDPSLNVWALSDTISDISSTAYPGYRFHIDLPYQINLTSFNYTTSTGRYPVQGTMLGSNDRTSWYNIYSFDLSGTYNNSTLQTGPITFYNNLASNTSLYSKYALVIKSMSCGSFSGTSFTLREMELYGNNNILSTQGIGATSIGVSDNLTVGATSNLYGNVTIGSINNVYNRTGAARLLIMEPSGTVASATSGSLVLQHGDASGVSSIVFRSTNDVGSDYAYIQYQESVGSGTTQKGLLTIGVENDAGSGTTADRMSLYAAGGSGFIGLNTLDPQYHLDLSGNARISGTVIASLDVSLNRNVDIGSGNNSVSINKDISSNFALDVSGITNLRAPLYTVADVSINGKLFATGDASFNQNLLVGQDLSVNRFLYVNNATLFNGDISTNQNLYVAGKATFGRPPATGGTYELDMSGQMRIYEQIGSNVTSNTSVATLTLEHADASGASSIMFKSPSTTSNGDYAYIKYQDLSGATTNAGLLTIGIENDPTATNADKISLYAAGGSGYVGVNTLNPGYNLDVSGNAKVSSTFYTNTIESLTSSSTLTIAGTDRVGSIFIGKTGSSSRTIEIGSSDARLYLGGSQIRLRDTGNGSVSFGRIASDTTQDSTGVTLLSGVNTTGSINILDGSGSTGTAIIGRNNAIQIVNSATTTVDVSATGLLTLRGSSLNVVGATRFNSDVSMNQNTRLGAGNNSVAVNKDISSQYALDVSGTTNLIGPLYTLGDVSLGQKLFVSGDVSVNTNLYVGRDVSINGNLYVANSVLLLNSDVSTNQNLYVAGRATFGRPPTSGTTYELDVSGQMRIYEQIGSNVISNTSVATLTLEHADASGASSIMFKSPSTTSNGDYAYIKYQDLSGATTNAGLLTIGVENDPTAATTRDRISLYAAGGSGFIGINTLDPSFNLDVSGNANVSSSLITNSIDVSNAASILTIAASQTTGNINIGASSRTSGNINLATGSGSQATALNWGTSSNSGQLAFYGGTFNFTSSGNLTFTTTYSTAPSINIATSSRNGGTFNLGTGDPSGATTNVFSGNATNNAILNIATGSRTAGSDINIATNTTSAETLNIGTGQNRTGTINMGTGNSGNKTIGIGGTLTTVNITGKSTTFTSDVSLNQNTRLGAGTNSVSINKDISSNFALDISGATNFRGVISTLSDISINGRLFTSGDASLNQRLFVNGDASLNQNLYIGQDVSINRFLYVASRTVLNSDASLNQNVKLGSGNNAIAINKDTNSAYALDISGATNISNGPLFVSAGDVSLNNKLFVNGDASLNQNLYIGQDVSINRFLYVASRTVLNSDASLNRNVKLGSGSNAIAINKDTNSAYALDISGTTNISNGPLFVSAGDVSLNNKLFVAQDASLNLNLYIGQDVSINRSLYVANAAVFNSDISTNQNLYVAGKATFGRPPATGTYELDISGQMRIYEAVGSNVTGNTSVATLTLEHADASGCSSIMFKSPSTISNGDYAYIKYQDLSGATTNNGLLTIGVENDPTVATTADKISLYAAGGLGYVGVNTLNPTFNFDVCGNARFSGNVTSNTFVAHTTTIAANIFGNSTGNITLGGVIGSSNTISIASSTSTGNVRIGGNIKLGYGISYVGVNKDPSAGFLFDVSGDSLFRNRLFVNSDASFGTNVNIVGDVSVNRYLYVTNRALFSNDVSINGNTRFSNSLGINTDPLLQYALDISGATNLRGPLFASADVSLNNKLFVSSDVSINTNLYVGQDASINRFLAVASRATINGDASLNQNVKLGSGSNAVAINKDINSAYALDISGTTNLSNGPLFVFGDVSLNSKLFVNSDASLNKNLYIGQDVSINRNLYVANQTVLTNDVSMNRNVDIGSGNNSVSINKDISSNFALDISGETNMRGNLTTFGNIAITGGNITVNGTPISTAGTGTSLTTQGVKVGTDTNYYVTVDKANFYNDPSLVIYYNFDTSVNGYKILNMAASGSTYDGSFNVSGTSTTTGMIDTTTKKFGAASLKNNPVTPISNAGVYVPNASSIPISTTMTFSMWVNKLGTPIAGTFDRIFEYSSGATVGENNSIALDISSSGILIPVLTSVATPCFGTLTSPILSYNICDGSWNHIVWTITPSTSYIYINGSIKHYDSITTAVPTTSRSSAYIAFTQFSSGTRDFSGNIDDYRYYSGKALNQAEIYQLYNNTFFNLDICGGFLANGSSVIYEPSGSRATANSGTLTLIHGDASGASSIMFKSVNDPLEYGYIQYEENSAGSTGYHYGLMTIGIENDAGTPAAYTTQADRVSLYPSGGQGFVGVNTKTPQYSLDVSGNFRVNNSVAINKDISSQYALDISGTMRILEGAGTSAAPTAGSLILEHTAVGGTSSIMFKGPNTTTSDYAYVQYTDASSVVQSLLKYDLSINSPTDPSGNPNKTVASTGTNSTVTTFWPTDNSFAWFSNTESINNVVTPAFCLSFNQANVTTGGTAISPLRMNYLETSYTMGSAADITFSAWIRPSGIDISQSTPGRIYILFAANGGTSGTGVIDMYIEINSNTNKGKLYCLINADGTNYQLTNVAINQNAWNHVALSFSSTNKNGQLYLNNVPATNELTGFNGKVLNYLDKFWIGVNYNGTTASSIYKAFRGRMAFINIFDKALPASDIAYLYNNPAYNVATNPERGLLTIGVENDTGTINNDRIVLWPGAGTGYVGINTRTPTATLDVSGTVQAVSYNATSDYRLKENVSPLDSLFNVDKLSPVTYTLKGSGKQDIGFIAHEVQELYPFLVNGVKDGPNTQSINYNGFIGILTKEIKDLKAKVQEQEERIIKQETRLEAMEKLLLNK